jgi:hypothetical protein
VSGFTERQILIEGWGYTDAAHRAHGRDGYRYANQPFTDQKLFQLNADAFADPSASVLDGLARLGVRWLFANTHRAAVSPELGHYADEVFRSEDVVIYSVRQSL